MGFLKGYVIIITGILFFSFKLNSCPTKHSSQFELSNTYFKDAMVSKLMKKI